MTRLTWNQSGARFFETGVDRGVLYPNSGNGVAWNGLVSVQEKTLGGEPTPLYFDGVKYLDILGSEDYQATIEAVTSPDEFLPSDGFVTLAPGLFATQQPRKTFGFCYRTLLGNDTLGTSYGYKLHVVYNATASPTEKSYSTIAASTNLSTRQWEINCVPKLMAPTNLFKPTAHFVIDSTKTTATKLGNLEQILYGNASNPPFLPDPSGILSVLA